MGKIIWYVGILSVTLLLFHFGGLIEDTPLSYLINLLIDPANAETSTFYSKLAGVLTAFAGGAAIIIGIFAPSKVEQATTIALTSFLFTIGWDMVAIFNVIKQASIPLATLIISPLLVIYLLTVIEWWRGKD